MTLSPKTIRVSVALLISVSFIAAGYFLSSPLLTSIANATSTEELLKAYAAKDTDSDGLPDWQESLYGTDIKNPHSVSPELTDKEAVDQGKIEPKFKSEALPEERVSALDIPGEVPAPGTLTDRFAKEFFQKFMLSEYAGTAPSSAQVEQFVASLIKDLDADGAIPDRYSLSDVRTGGTGAAALETYAATMTQGMNPNGAVIEKDEITLLNDAIVNDNKESLVQIQRIAKAYRAVAEGMSGVAAPEEAVRTHLEIMNAAVKLSSTMEDMAAFNEDPVRTLVGIGQYPAAGVRLLRALTSMHTLYIQTGVRLTPDDPGYPFFMALEQVAAMKIPDSAPLP